MEYPGNVPSVILEYGPGVFMREEKMRYLLNARQMKACDETTTNTFKVPSAVLMERSAIAVRDVVLERFPDAARILVICGFST